MLITKSITIFTLAAAIFFTACNEKEDVGVRPSVVSTDPISDAGNIAVSSQVTAMFSEVMDGSTNTKFSLTHGATVVEGTTVYNELSVSFTPVANLLPNTIYIATIDRSAKSLSGSSMFDDYIWEFTTGDLPDTSLPTVTSTNPENDAADVDISTAVVFTFSEEMDQSTISASTFVLKQGTEVIAGEISVTATTATFTSFQNLDGNKIYSATITAEVKDLAGNAMAASKLIVFTTGEAPDTSVPRVDATNPLNDATEVPLDEALSVTFSEEMDAATISTASFTLNQGENSVSGTVTYTNKVATFTPDAFLESGLVYTASILEAAKDLAGNALAAATVWSFTTVADASAPTITEVNPLDNATGVVLNQTISATFGEEMDAATISDASFTLKQGTNSVLGTVAYNNKVATFNPDANLQGGLVYTATITTVAADLAGNMLTAEKVWSFTTSNSSSNLATVDLGSSANYVVLAKSAISTVPTSKITGDMGLSPAATTYITGFDLVDFTGYATSTQVVGKVYAADMASPTPTNLTVAVEDMMLAYTDAAGRQTPDFLELATGSIGGLTLTSGLYKWTTTVDIANDIVISGGADDIWIFQISGDLSMASAKNITLSGGAQAKNIFWQVAGSVSVGTNSAFQGIILSKNDIVLQTGTSLFGRALAQKAVNLDSNEVTKPE